MLHVLALYTHAIKVALELGVKLALQYCRLWLPLFADEADNMSDVTTAVDLVLGTSPFRLLEES